MNSDFLAFTPRTFELHIGDGSEVIDLLRILVGLPPQASQKPSARALGLLKPVGLADIPEEEIHCNVCYDPFESVPTKAIAGYTSAVELDRATPESERSSVTFEKWFEAEQKDDDHYALQMPCGHKFGRGCLLTWLDTSPTCPMCRSKLETEFEFQQGTSGGPDFLRTENGATPDRPQHFWVRATDLSEHNTPAPEGEGEQNNDSPRPMVVHFISNIPTAEQQSPQSLRRFQRMVMQRAVREAFGNAAPGSALRPPEDSPQPPRPVFGPNLPRSVPSSRPGTPQPAQGPEQRPQPERAAPDPERPTWRLSPWLDRGLVGFYAFYQHILPHVTGGPPTNDTPGDEEAAQSSPSSAGDDSEPATPQSENSQRRGPQRHNLRRNHPYR